MFPEKHGVDYSILKMTPEGEYSITRRNDGKKILQRMTSILGTTKQKCITDLTGNVGGDTILFGLNFGRTDSIEIDNDNFAALKHNVETFRLKNVKLHHGDCTQLFDWKTDVLYMDPPWGGPEYKEKENLDLFLGKQRIDSWLSTILEEDWRPNFVFIKLPSNYNFDRLKDLPNVFSMQRFAIRGFYLIGLVIDV
jgi:hypothetical protein